MGTKDEAFRLKLILSINRLEVKLDASEQQGS